jgi:hypothetical protein
MGVRFSTQSSVSLTSDTAAPTLTPLTNQLLDGINLTMLLTDGTVMAQDGSYPYMRWKLTPDINGSYLNGTWTQLASLAVPGGRCRSCPGRRVCGDNPRVGLRSWRTASRPNPRMYGYTPHTNEPRIPGSRRAEASNMARSGESADRIRRVCSGSQGVSERLGMLGYPGDARHIERGSRVS